ncbi:hypothetical protein SAMN04488123_10136 [Natribacillus halophilus]|uniref:Uncharacterized protein n=1 Tax=Natribacillus halophilus TaxID=549003 RepID=A0A1G8J5W5_9BACI|nr:hypothetical protein SAMN04488123_10136 [Natribacillus halophilus]
MDFDVIVVGAGLAGLVTTAENLPCCKILKEDAKPKI